MEQNNNQIAVRPVQKTAVMIRREMVKIPAVMDALGPVERAVFLASTAKTIVEYNAAELSAELAVALKWICKDVGYRSPDESDRQYLIIRTAEPAACLFENSRFAEYNAFAAEFTAPEFADVDMVYYYHAVADWSAQKGKKMKDWIATARNFIRGDMEKGKLHRKSGTGPGLSPDAIKYLQDMAD